MKQYKLRNPHVRRRHERMIFAIMFVAAIIAFSLLVFMAVAWMVWLSGGTM